MGFAASMTCGMTVIGFRRRVVDIRTVPNEGIRRSLNHVLIFALGGALAGVCSGVLVGFVQGSMAMLVFGVAGGLLALLMGGLSFGVPYGGRAVIQHYTLRLLLVQSGAMPWDIAALLDAAAHRSLLRRAGGGWVFTHRMLLEFFRDLSDEELEELVRG